MKKLLIKHKIAVFGLIGIALVMAGCATSQPVVTPVTHHMESITFPKDMYADSSFSVTNEDDPHQIISFALSLSNRGRHDQAAKFFEEAAARFVSENNELAVSCRAAAANEYLKADDIASFRRAVVDLKHEMNRFQFAAVDRSTATILALYDISTGIKAPTATTPAELRELY